jgi:two-component system sensor histidine kinase YesM
MLDSEKEKALGQYIFIKQEIENDIENLNNNGKLSEAIKNIMRYYSNYYSSQNISFLLQQNRKCVYSNLQYGKEKLDSCLFNMKSGQNIVITEQKHSKFVLIAGVTDSIKNGYSLICCYKLEGIMDALNRLEKVFICSSFFISLILAILLAMLLNNRSKPLKQLMIFVNLIKSGEYGSKINVRGKDEFAMLANNFNEMPV